MLFSLFSFFLAFFLHVLIARPVLRRNGRRFGGTLCGRDEYKKKNRAWFGARSSSDIVHGVVVLKFMFSLWAAGVS